jgi:hypothetical protein
MARLFAFDLVHQLLILISSYPRQKEPRASNGLFQRLSFTLNDWIPAPLFQLYDRFAPAKAFKCRNQQAAISVGTRAVQCVSEITAPSRDTKATNQDRNLLDVEWCSHPLVQPLRNKPPLDTKIQASGKLRRSRTCCSIDELVRAYTSLYEFMRIRIWGDLYEYACIRSTL